MANIKGLKRGKYKITSKNNGWFKSEGKLNCKECLQCGSAFESYRSKYCCHKCYSNSRVGIKRPEHSIAMSKDNLTYSGIHSWIDREFKKSDECEHCQKNPGLAKDGRNLIHWANKTGNYLKNRDDWICLCQSCHSKYDKPWLNKEIIRNEKGQIMGIKCTD